MLYVHPTWISVDSSTTFRGYLKAFVGEAKVADDITDPGRQPALIREGWYFRRRDVERFEMGLMDIRDGEMTEDVIARIAAQRFEVADPFQTLAFAAAAGSIFDPGHAAGGCDIVCLKDFWSSKDNSNRGLILSKKGGKPGVRLGACDPDSHWYGRYVVAVYRRRSRG